MLFLRHALVVAFVGLLAFGGIRGAVLGDLRFSWGMFAYEVSSDARYSFVMPDGRIVEYQPPKGELRARQKKVAPGVRVSAYGIGAVRSWVGAYLEWLWANRRPEGATQVRAQLTWTRDRDAPVTELLEFPGRTASGSRTAP